MDFNSPGGRNHIHSQHRLSVLLVVCFLILALIPEALATTETRYFRSDTATVNGLNTEKLSTSRSGTSGNRSKLINDYSDPPATRAYWGIRVWKRASGGAETEISSGSPVALIYRASAGAGIQSSTWACPQTSLASTDSIIVRVYVSLWDSGSGFWGWNLLDTWQTEQLSTTILNSATWTVYYYAQLSIVSGAPKKWTPMFIFDTSTYNSRIENFVYGEITKSWHSLTWSSTLTTRTWRSLSWAETLTTRAWQSLTWAFELTGKAWSSVVWILELTGKTWNELVWDFSLGPESGIAVLWIGLLAFSCLIILVCGVIFLKRR